MIPAVIVIHHRSTSWRAMIPIAKSTVPLMTRKKPSNAARIVNVWNGDVMAAKPPSRKKMPRIACTHLQPDTTATSTNSATPAKINQNATR